MRFMAKPRTKLDTYLRGAGLDDEAFATMVDASTGAVRKWRYGERVPRPQQMVRIKQATAGAVTADDFMPAELEQQPAA